MRMGEPEAAPVAYAIFNATALEAVYRDVNTNARSSTHQKETPL